MLSNKKNLHFVGIGGIGMSGIAIVLSGLGYKISGSDLKPNNLTKKIEDMGGKIFKGHTSSNLPRDVEAVVYSTSVSSDNPEIVKAKRMGLPIVHRAEVLAYLLNKAKGIAVTGTHGKTTTTSLIGVMLENCRFDPTVIIGGEVDLFNGNAKLGKGDYLVAEADESDSSFMYFRPIYSVITNIEMEHIDHFKTLKDAISAYRVFANNLKVNGILFYNYEDHNIRKVLKNFKGVTRSFGFSKKADIHPTGIEMSEFTSSFNCIYNGENLGKVNLKIPGKHNVLNSLACILLGLNLGLKFEDIVHSIKDFTGAKRRFHLRTETKDIMLIDDYAHHPTEIRAVLAACRNWPDKRVVAIFQPHRYTRTKFLAGDFGKCFKGADKLILTDIYAASEKPIEGISVKTIYDKVIKSGLKDVRIMKKGDIADHVFKIKRPGDMILVLGAGDIKEVADELFERFKKECDIHEEHPVEGLKKIVKGRALLEEMIGPHTSFKIGGPANIWIEPDDMSDLRQILRFARVKKMPVFVIGSGSNLLVRDNGYKGIVIHLESDYFKKIKVKGSRVSLGAGFSMPRLVKLCNDKGLGGLESLVGIPGTVGGAIYMNAGGSSNPIYKNIGEFVTLLKVMDYSGNIKVLRRRELRFGYRCSNLDPYIILEAVLKLEKESPEALNSRCSKFLKMKKEKQVLDIPSAGCVFKNPENFQFTCGQMIDMLGLKGVSIGGAEVSRKHANFIVNKRGATSEDVLKLLELIKYKVKDNFDISLELEIKVV